MVHCQFLSLLATATRSRSLLLPPGHGKLASFCDRQSSIGNWTPLFAAKLTAEGCERACELPMRAPSIAFAKPQQTNEYLLQFSTQKTRSGDSLPFMSHNLYSQTLQPQASRYKHLPKSSTSDLLSFKHCELAHTHTFNLRIPEYFIVASSKQNIASLLANYFCESDNFLNICITCVSMIRSQPSGVSLRVGPLFSIINRMPAGLSATDDRQRYWWYFRTSARQ